MTAVRKFDACTPRPKFNSRREVWWMKIGNAMENDKGQIHIYLDAVPIPNEEGSVQISLFEKREEDRLEPKSERPERRSTKPKNDDDEIPF